MRQPTIPIAPGQTDPADDADIRHLTRCIELAREAVANGSSPIGCVIVDRNGRLLAEGRNRAHEPWPKTRGIADSSFAHAEMDAFYRVGRFDDAPGATLYSSLEPCLMCGGAAGLIELGRVVWACDDPWGGSGRLIQWNGHPAYTHTRVTPHPSQRLETEAARLFALEVLRVYPAQGLAAWRERYPDAMQAAERESSSTS